MPKKKTLSKKVRKISLLRPIFNYRNQLIGLALLIIGLFLLIGLPNVNSKKNKNNPIQISEKLISFQVNKKIPVGIIIPSVKIDNTISEAKIINGYWETSETSLSYGQGSGVPGEIGNIIVFGHAREGLFYNLKNIKNKDTVYVLTKDRWHRYQVEKIIKVYPNQKEIIMPTKKETLTLYTCTGFNDEQRLVIIAVPSK